MNTMQNLSGCEKPTSRCAQVQAKEEHTDAVKMVEECRQKLKSQKQSVAHWKGRVDRQCVERLKAFQNPPMLVGFVMEMVMIFIGKKLTSDRLERRDNYPSRDNYSGQFSASSSGTKIGPNKCKPNKEQSNSQ